MGGRYSVLDCKFAAINEAVAIEITEHLIAGLNHSRVNKTRMDKYKLVLSFKCHWKHTHTRIHTNTHTLVWWTILKRGLDASCNYEIMYEGARCISWNTTTVLHNSIKHQMVSFDFILCRLLFYCYFCWQLEESALNEHKRIVLAVKVGFYHLGFHLAWDICGDKSTSRTKDKCPRTCFAYWFLMFPAVYAMVNHPTNSLFQTPGKNTVRSHTTCSLLSERMAFPAGQSSTGYHTDNCNHFPWNMNVVVASSLQMPYKALTELIQVTADCVATSICTVWLQIDSAEPPVEKLMMWLCNIIMITALLISHFHSRQCKQQLQMYCYSLANRPT